MNRETLVNQVAANLDCKKVEAERAVTGVLDAISTGLTDDREIKLTNFGSFKVTDVAEHEGRNPRTGEPVVVPANIRVTFKPGQQLKDSVFAGPVAKKTVAAKKKPAVAVKAAPAAKKAAAPATKKVVKKVIKKK